MRLPQPLGFLLLGLWLVLFNLVPLLSLGGPTVSTLIALLGVAAGGVILWERRS